MKIVKYFSITIIAFFFLMMYSTAVYYYTNGGSFLEFLKEPVVSFAKFPFKVKNALTSYHLTGIPDTYIKNSPVEEVNNLDYDLFALNSFWNNESNHWEIRLFNFRNDSVIHNWNLFKNPELQFNHIRKIYRNARPKHSLLLPNKNLIVALSESPNLLRLDSSSNVVWMKNDLVYHHSMSYDNDGNIWTCTRPYDGNSGVQFEYLIHKAKDHSMHYLEEYITKIDAETGEILYNKSLSQMLLDNHYVSLLYGHFMYDPLHINDVEPALKDGKFWKKGDVFISLRSSSTIILYRPSTNKIIKVLMGPFMLQHDVDIISDKEISVFNNNSFRYQTSPNLNKNEPLAAITSSGITIYNFESDSFSSYNKDFFEEHNIFSETEGLSEFLSNGDVFVESQNDGIIYIMNDSDDLVLRKVFKTEKEGYIQMPNWIRVYEELPYE